MRILILLVVLMGTASAGKPKPAADQAKKTVDAWIEAMNLSGEPDPAAAVPLTAMPFFAIAMDEMGETSCKAQTAKTEGDLKKLLGCFAKVARGDRFEPWTAKLEKQMQGKIRDYRKKLTAANKADSVVLVDHEQCVGQGSDFVIVVGFDKDGTTPKVTAAYYASVFCGE